MTGKTHAAAGTITGILLTDAFLTSASVNEEKDIPLATVLITATIVGSIFPDIDMKKSLISQLLFPFRFGYWMLEKIFGDKWFRHRGITHTLILPLILAVIALIPSLNPYIYYICIGLIFGILSHLLLDMLNPVGVPLFGPISSKTFRLLPKSFSITTGTIFENVFFVLLILVGSYLKFNDIFFLSERFFEKMKNFLSLLK